MSMTVGFAFRFGDFPPAVMLPPAQVSVERRSDVIEAQIVHETSVMSAGNSLSDGNMRRGMQSKDFFRNEPLTYTPQGSSDTPFEGNGFLLDLYV